MAWTYHEYEKQIHIGGKPTKFTATKQVATNEDGVEIEGAGSLQDFGSYLLFFDYWDGAIALKFRATRPHKELASYDPTKNDPTLGPVVIASIDEGEIKSLSTTDLEKVKRNISDFLLHGYSKFRTAVRPYPEQVVFLN